MEKKTIGILAALAFLGIVITKKDTPPAPPHPYWEPIIPHPFTPPDWMVHEFNTSTANDFPMPGNIDGSRKRIISGF